MKPPTKRIILFSQIPSTIFLLIYFVCKILLKNDYELYLFGSTWLKIIHDVSFTIFLIIEFISVIILIVKTKKLLLIVLDVILLPILLLQIFVTDFKIDTINSIKEYFFEEFDKNIVIENRSFLLSGDSIIHEKINSFLIRKVTSIGGDDGRCPLEDESEFTIEVIDNQICFFYFFDYDRSEDAIQKHIIKYENGHFEESKYYPPILPKATSLQSTSL